MVVEHASPPVSFAGTKKQQALAAEVVNLLRAHGRFMATTAPIRVTFASLASYVEAQGRKIAELEAALAANPDVFSVEAIDGERMVITTHQGRAVSTPEPPNEHTFAERFMTPLPKPKRRPTPIRVPPPARPIWPSITDVVTTGDTAPVDDLLTTGDAASADELLTVAAAPTVDEAPPIEVVTPAAPPVAETVAPPAAPPVAETVAPPVEVAATDEVVSTDETAALPLEVAAPEAAPAVEPEPIVPPVAAEPPPEPRPTPVPEPEPVAPVRTITVPAAAISDVSGIDDPTLAAAIADRLRADPRVSNFGDQWLAEDRVPRFSRGDIRRLKDYIQEREQPLTDDALVQDSLAVRPNAPDFEVTRFAINFRLSREHRDFEFVGTADQRFWSTSSLPQIGTNRRKPNEIGTDFRYLIDEVGEAPAPRSISSLDHVVTFYEYYHGLLPYDAQFQALLPAPLTAEQRSTVLTFECPQTYTTYLVELRHPTPNRGGFLLGLDDFYSESLVPGALISINATENDGHYRVEYLAAGSQSERLLELDDRRALRYIFRPTTYTCAVAAEMLLTEERYPRLGSEKPLDDRVRRRPEAVVATSFERIGQESDSGAYRAVFDALFAAVNIERPFSESLLRSILENDDTGAFARDPDVADGYTYVPGSKS